MNLNNVYDYDGSFSDNPVVLAMYEGITTTLDEYYDSLQAPPLSALLMPQDLDAIHRVITSAKLSGNGEKRIFAIRDIMARRGFTQLAGGTNRSVFTHPNYPNIAVKVAIDNVGIHDNPAEYNNQFILKPYCTKCFEVSADGAVGVFEKVGRIRNSVEFYQMWDDIYSLCEYFVTEKELLLEDFGIKFFMNWGIRYGFGPVLLDFPYVYDIDWDKLHCDRPNDDGTICNGNIDYDDRFDFLVCEKCGKRYRAVDIAKKREVGKGVLTKILGGKKMQITLKRGNEVIMETNTPDVSKTIGRPAVAKSWRNKIMSNEAAGISSDSVKVKLVRGGKEIAAYQASKVDKKEEDFGLVVKVTRGEEEVVEDTTINSSVEENSGLTVKVTREAEPVVEEGEVEASVVEENAEENVTEETPVVEEPAVETPVVEENVEEPVVEESETHDGVESDDLAEESKIESISDDDSTIDPNIEFTAFDAAAEFNKILESRDNNHIADVIIEEELENSNSKRPAKKAKKSSKKIEKNVEEKPKASKKKSSAKKTTKASKPVEIVEDPEDPKPALDTSTDTEIMTDIAATLDTYEAPVETEAEVAHDMVEEMVASGQPISLELIRNSDTKVTVDDILNNY